jgi:hypothetical protein
MSILNEVKGFNSANNNNKQMKFIYSLFPLCVIFAVLFAFLWMFAVGKFGFVVRGVFTGIPAVISCIIVLFIYKKDMGLSDILIFPSISRNSLIYLFGIFYLGSVSTLLLSQGGRSWYYFIFIVLLYILILLQIFSENSNPSVILAEIFLSLLNLTYSVTLNYDLYFGTTDIMPHILLSEMTAMSGHIVSTSLTDYAYFPLYHIMVAASSLILHMGIKSSLFLITAPIYAITIFFLYYLFLSITQNRQISLLSCLLFSSSSVVLYYGANMITRTMSFVMFVVLLYLLYSVNFKESKLSLKILSVIVVLFLTLVHNVSLPQFVLLLVILLVCESLVNVGSYISKPFFILLNVIFTSYWFFVAYLFVQRGITIRLQSQLWDSMVLTSEGLGNVNEYLINLVGYLDGSVFLFFALIGIGFLLKKHKNNYASVFGLFALFTLIFYIPNPLNTIWQLHVLFRIDRFKLFVSPFMAFVMSYGIYVFWNYLSKSSSKKGYPLFFIFLLFSTFVFVSSVYSISDSESLIVESAHPYFTAPELRGFEHIKCYVPAGSYIYSDYYASRYFYFPRIPGASEENNLSFFRSYRIADVNNFAQYSGYIVIRTREFLRAGLYLSEGGNGVESANYFYRGTSENELEMNRNLNKINKIYSSPAEDIFIGGSRVH